MNSKERIINLNKNIDPKFNKTSIDKKSKKLENNKHPKVTKIIIKI